MKNLDCLTSALLLALTPAASNASDEITLPFEKPVVKTTALAPAYLPALEAQIRKLYDLPAGVYSLVRSESIRTYPCENDERIGWISFDDGVSVADVPRKPGQDADEILPFIGGSGGSYYLYFIVNADLRSIRFAKAFQSIAAPILRAKKGTVCPGFQVPVHGSHFQRTGYDYGIGQIELGESGLRLKLERQ